MLLKNPKVSIIMTVYNGEKYIIESIESILDQQFKNFEFIIINDNSTDKSYEIIKHFDCDCIKIINNKTNIGMTKSLNNVIKTAKGDYIALMDQDDISYPDRISTQVEFLDKNLEIDICGTYVKIFFENGNEILFTPPTNHDHIKSYLLFGSPMIHPTVMFRKKSFEKNNVLYDTEKYKCCEDYKLWCDIIDKLKFANIDKVLLRYRRHINSDGEKYEDIQYKYSQEIRCEQLSKLGVFPDKYQLFLHEKIDMNMSHKLYIPDNIMKFINDCENWLIRIIESNNVYKIYNNEALELFVKQKWKSLCMAYIDQQNGVYDKYRSSILYKLYGGNFKCMYQ